MDGLFLEFSLQGFTSHCLFWFFLFGSHESFILSGRRVPRRGVPPDQSFFGSHFLEESFVISVLFRCHLGLGNMNFHIGAITKAIIPGMETGAHLSAAKPVNSVANILVTSKNFAVFLPISHLVFFIWSWVLYYFPSLVVYGYVVFNLPSFVRRALELIFWH